MKITVKQINKLIAPKSFEVFKEGSKYILKNKKTKWQLKGTLTANYEKILGLAGVEVPKQEELIDTNQINDDVKQLFHYAYDIMWGDYKDNIEKAKLICFKSTDLNGIASKINYNKDWIGFRNNEPLFNSIWRNIIRFQFQYDKKQDYTGMLAKFENEVKMKNLIKG